MPLDMGSARGDTDAPDVQGLTTASAPVQVQDLTEAQFADGVVRLIQQQLLLMSEQLKCLAEAPPEKPVR